MKLIDNNSLKTNVCGVTVLYNPSKDTIENIDSYLEQINYLLVIDNSKNPSNFVIDYYKNNHNVEYIFNNDNLGIAKALNIWSQKSR